MSQTQNEKLTKLEGEIDKFEGMLLKASEKLVEAAMAAMEESPNPDRIAALKEAILTAEKQLARQERKKLEEKTG
jgi:hypothetical protein